MWQFLRNPLQGFLARFNNKHALNNTIEFQASLPMNSRNVTLVLSGVFVYCQNVFRLCRVKSPHLSEVRGVHMISGCAQILPSVVTEKNLNVIRLRQVLSFRCVQVCPYTASVWPCGTKYCHSSVLRCVHTLPVCVWGVTSSVIQMCPYTASLWSGGTK